MVHSDNLKKVKITILAIAMLQMITSGLAPGLSALAEAFPDKSVLQVQMSMSCIGIIVLLMSLVTDRIYAVFTRKKSVIAALALMIAVGVAAYFFHPSLEMIYVYCGLLGISLALYIPAVGSVIIDCFTGEERGELTGTQSSFCSLGGIIISFLGGVFAATHWYTTYLIFLFAIPALILTILYFPQDEKKVVVKEKSGGKKVLSREIWIYGGICLAFVTIYGTCGNNLSLFVAEEKLGSTVLSGSLSAIGMLGGVAGGFLFGKYFNSYKEKLFPIIFAIQAVGFIVLAVSHGIWTVVITVFVMGLIQCMMMPCCLLVLSEKVRADQTVFASSIICAVAPNLSGVISPLIITNLSGVLFQGSIRGRFTIAGAMAVIMAVGMAVMVLDMTKKETNKN